MTVLLGVGGQLGPAILVSGVGVIVLSEVQGGQGAVVKTRWT
ncbi:hypothetical protein [Nonomuraea sp. NPDC049758]